MSEPLDKVMSLFKEEPKIVFTLAIGLMMIVMIIVVMKFTSEDSSAGTTGEKKPKKKRKKKKKAVQTTASQNAKKASSGRSSSSETDSKSGASKKKAAPSKAGKTTSSEVGKKKKKNKKKGKPQKVTQKAAAQVDDAASSDEESSKKDKASESQKISAEQRIRKKMAAAARKSIAYDSSEKSSGSDDGWSTATNKKKNRGGASKQKSQSGASKHATPASVPADTSGPATAELKCMVDRKKLGNIIGPKGATMHAIQDATGVKIDTPRRTGGADGAGTAAQTLQVAVTITGPREACIKAKKAIKELCTKGYSTLLNAGGDFVEAPMVVPSGSIPEIFGAGGAVIRKIQDGCEVRIHVPEQKEASASSDTRRITIAGPKEGTKRARAVVDSIVRYHHHPSTHPGIVHVKIPIPNASDMGSIIGRGGSSIKHIQGTTKTRVYTPKQIGIDALEVMVVGPQKGVDTAHRMILKILEENDHIVKEMSAGAHTAAPADPDDPWGAIEGEDDNEEDLWDTPKPSSTMTIELPSQ